MQVFHKFLSTNKKCGAMPKVLQACHWLPQTFIVERKHMALCTHKIMHNRETAVQNTWWSGTVDRKWKID